MWDACLLLIISLDILGGFFISKKKQNSWGVFLLLDIILVQLGIIFQNGFLELGFFRENLLSNQSFKSWIMGSVMNQEKQCCCDFLSNLINYGLTKT